MRGRPPGKWNDKAFKDALRVAVNRNAKGGGRKLARLADVLLNAGLAGDVTAIKEIADRLDGKPQQSVDVAVTDERNVIRSPAPAETPEDWRTTYTPKPH